VLDPDCPRDVLDARQDEGSRPGIVEAEVADDGRAVSADDLQVRGFVDEKVAGFACFGRRD
jgi:hypothetical protein